MDAPNFCTSCGVSARSVASKDCKAADCPVASANRQNLLHRVTHPADAGRMIGHQEEAASETVEMPAKSPYLTMLQSRLHAQGLPGNVELDGHGFALLRLPISGDDECRNARRCFFGLDTAKIVEMSEPGDVTMWEVTERNTDLLTTAYEYLIPPSKKSLELLGKAFWGEFPAGPRAMVDQGQGLSIHQGNIVFVDPKYGATLRDCYMPLPLSRPCWEPFAGWTRDEFVFRMGMVFQHKRDNERSVCCVIYADILQNLVRDHDAELDREEARKS